MQLILGSYLAFWGVSVGRGAMSSLDSLPFTSKLDTPWAWVWMPSWQCWRRRAGLPPLQSPAPAMPWIPGVVQTLGAGGLAGSCGHPSHVLPISRPHPGEGAATGLSLTRLGPVSAPRLCSGWRRPQKGSTGRGSGGWES